MPAEKKFVKVLKKQNIENEIGKRIFSWPIYLSLAAEEEEEDQNRT